MEEQLGLEFVPDPKSKLLYHQQWGLHLARTQCIEFRDGIAEVPWQDPKTGRAALCVVRRDAEGKFKCAVHYKPGLNAIQCQGIIAVQYTVSPLTAMPIHTPTYDPQIDVGQDPPNSALAPILGGAPLLDAGLDKHMEAPRYRTKDRRLYDEARRHATSDFLHLVSVLCDMVEARPIKDRGRRPVPLGNLIRATLTREYLHLKYRPVEGFLLYQNKKEAWPGKVPHANKLNQFDRDDEAIDALWAFNAMIVSVLSPLSSGRCTSDGTGHGSTRFFPDYRQEGKVERQGGRIEKRAIAKGKNRSHTAQELDPRRHVWYHAHVLSDPDSFIALGVLVTEMHGDERAALKYMLPKVLPYYPINIFASDGGYGSWQIRDFLAELGIQAFIPYPAHGKHPFPPAEARKVKNKEMLVKLFHMLSAEPEKFWAEQHKSWKRETLFSAVKEKFGDHVTSKSFAGARVQIMSKYICHNIESLAFALRAFGLDSAYFGKQFSLPEAD